MEVRERGRPRAAAAAVGAEGLDRGDAGGVGEWLADELVGGQRLAEVLDEIETDDTSA